MTSPHVNQTEERNGPVRQSSVGPSAAPAPALSEGAEADLPRRVLFLDDDPVRAETFLLENPRAVWVQTVAECLGQLVETWDEVHLDHDLGGKTFVDVNESDCGMEVIRWLCKEPRDHLRNVRFLIHTHNSLAGLLMVLQMRASGYRAEFRPFGMDLAELLLPHDDNESSLDAERPWDTEMPPDRLPPQSPPQPPLGTLERLIGLLKPLWRSSRAGKK
jgi:hypothetical protein